jgi:NAD(P)-dependent dehydrogenase (short-subunit alcohol dehydrogenase family)
MSIKAKIEKIVKILNGKEKIPIVEVQQETQLLTNKVVLITGGSGGIGFAIAKKCLASGAKVIIAGTSEQKLNAKVKECDTQSIKALVLNLNDVSSFEAKIQEACGLFEENRIDVLVNSAGVNPAKKFFDITEKDFDTTMAVNVKGIFFMCQAMAKYMIENKIKGHILNLSSSSALRPAWGPYEMSKWTIKGFTVGLADTLIKHGIVVNAIAPGPTATPMLGKEEGDDLDLPNNPTGRYAMPEEIAELAVMLISDAGKLVVGDTLYATGGAGTITMHN